MDNDNEKQRAQTLIAAGVLTIVAGLIPMHWCSGSLGVLGGLYLIAAGVRRYQLYDAQVKEYRRARGRLLAEHHHRQEILRMQAYVSREAKAENNAENRPNGVASASRAERRTPRGKKDFTPGELRQYFGPDAEMRVGGVTLGTVAELEENGG